MSFRRDGAISLGLKKASVEIALRLSLALAGGLGLTMAFPNWGVAGLGWVAPALILAAGLGCQRGTAVFLGCVSGASFYLTSLVWLLRIPFPSGALAGWAALSAYCTLYPAAWVWLCTRMAPLANDGAGGFLTFSRLARASWHSRLIWCLFCAASWTALEIMRGRFLTGFPWNFLAASQFRMLPIIQVSAWTGIYGVGFLMVWFAISLLCATAVLLTNPGLRRSWMADMIVPLLVVCGTTAMGFDRLTKTQRLEVANSGNRKLRVGIVQPAIPQTIIFDSTEAKPRFEKLLALSESILGQHPDVLVWPEGGMPPWTEENYRGLQRMLVSHHVAMILCADDSERTPDGPRYYNSAFQFAPDGAFVATYHKRRLVIFGEYVPLEDWLPFIRRFTPIEGEFTPGTKPGEFDLTEPSARLGILICFEDMFADPTRAYVRQNTDALLNLTNDGWFGESSAQWQQLASAVFRAVENGVPLIRCTNNGISCWVDAAGRQRQILEKDGNVYAPGATIFELPLAPEGGYPPTFYHQHGDWFGWSCVAWVLICWLRAFGIPRIIARFRPVQTANIPVSEP